MSLSNYNINNEQMKERLCECEAAISNTRTHIVCVKPDGKGHGVQLSCIVSKSVVSVDNFS